MKNFWSNVFAGTIGAVLSAATLATIGELRPLGLHLIIPEDAVIPMAGECPPGWRQYDAANGRYIVAPAGKVLEDRSEEQSDAAGSAFAEDSTALPRSDHRASSGHPGARRVLPLQAPLDILGLCQRR
jgi:hypothetical protein